MNQKIVNHETDSILIMTFIHDYTDIEGEITPVKTIETRGRGALCFLIKMRM